LAKGPSSKAAHGLAYPAGDLFAWLIPKGDTFAWLIPQGDTIIYARSVPLVREHGKMATCLREAAPAKAENAAGGFFQQTH